MTDNERKLLCIVARAVAKMARILGSPWCPVGSHVERMDLQNTAGNLERLADYIEAKDGGT